MLVRTASGFGQKYKKILEFSSENFQCLVKCSIFEYACLRNVLSSTKSSLTQCCLGKWWSQKICTNYMSWTWIRTKKMFLLTCWYKSGAKTHTAVPEPHSWLYVKRTYCFFPRPIMPWSKMYTDNLRTKLAKFNFLMLCSSQGDLLTLILLFTTTPTFANCRSRSDGFCLWIWIKTSYDIIWLADSQKWVWLIKLFSRIRVNEVRK